MEKCHVCGGEIKEASATMKQKTIEGKEVRVVNVPAQTCVCKNERSTLFSFLHAMIVEDFVREMQDNRDIVDFKEIEKKYEGVTTMDIMEKHKK